MRKQYHSFPLEVRSLSQEEGTFEGYASVFGNVDSYESTFTRGCFNKTLKENRSRVKVLWQHNQEEPIGVPIDLTSDDHGLLVKAKISDTTRGRDALTLLRDKVITDMSFGFDVISDAWKNGIRQIKEVRLWEVSLVTWGSNDLANITAVRQRAAVEHRDFDADFDAAQLRQQPFLLVNVFQRTLDEAIYGNLNPQEKYEALHSMLNQFDERMAQWIEDAYAAMSQRAFVFERDQRSLTETQEPEAATTPEPERADEVPDDLAHAMEEMFESLKNMMEVYR